MCFPQEDKGEDAEQTKITGVHNKHLLCARYMQFEKNLKGHLMIITFKNTKGKCVLNGYHLQDVDPVNATFLHANHDSNTEPLHLLPRTFSQH